MTWLLDGNLLVALRIDTHVSHAAAQRWFTGHRRDRFATCPVTQGTLLRVHMRLALDGSVDAAWEALREISEHPRHEFWADNFSRFHPSLPRFQTEIRDPSELAIV